MSAFQYCRVIVHNYPKIERALEAKSSFQKSKAFEEALIYSLTALKASLLLVALLELLIAVLGTY